MLPSPLHLFQTLLRRKQRVLQAIYLASTRNNQNSYVPGHIHAFYLLYVFYDRRHRTGEGIPLAEEAPGVFSPEVQSGGVGGGGLGFSRKRGGRRFTVYHVCGLWLEI